MVHKKVGHLSIFVSGSVAKKEHNQIDYDSNLVLIGSCFSENISKKLNYFKFKTFSNPFGILFNPKAIDNLIAKSINKVNYTEKDLFQLNERWHCFDAHSDLSEVDKIALISPKATINIIRDYEVAEKHRVHLPGYLSRQTQHCSEMPYPVSHLSAPGTPSG